MLGTLESNSSQIKNVANGGITVILPVSWARLSWVAVSPGHYHRVLGRKLLEQSLGKMPDGIKHGVMRSQMVLAQVADVCEKHLSAQESCQMTAAHMPPRSLCPAIGWIDQAPPHPQMICPDVALFDLGVINGHRPPFHRTPRINVFSFLLFFFLLLFCSLE